MSPVWLALPIIAALAALAWMTVWSRKDTYARPAAMVLFLVSIPVVAYVGLEALGRHKPMDFAGLKAGDYHVLAAVMHQDDAIFIYLIDPTRSEPLPAVLPWTNETAQAMQEAMDGAPEGREGEFVIRIDPDQETEVTAHPLPQPATPPAKDTPDEGFVYEPEG